ncbi:MAG: hypothetical protein RML72_02780 [Bacteroidia bacterium]|nr:hypothetical protein [Bacteroidia bacterium]MDW8157785.1 hypothetical protein [Bacteroidia bacterium]
MKLIFLGLSIVSVWYNLCIAQSWDQLSLGQFINSPFPELQPRISICGRFLYFVRSEPKPNTNGNNFNQEIWCSQRTQQGWQKPYKLPYPINSTANDAVCTVLPGNKTLLLSGRYYSDSTRLLGASITTYQHSNWSLPENLLIPGLVSENGFANFYLSVSGQYLVVELNNSAGFGKQDLYVCFRRNNGRWSSPINLGKDINSPYHDFAPFLAADEQTLYFASTRPGGLGNADIWMSRRLDDTWQRWSPPINLGPTINSENFEAYFSTTAAGEVAYYVTDLENKGNTDILATFLPPLFRPFPVVFFKGRMKFFSVPLAVQPTIKIRDLEKNTLVPAFWDADSLTFCAILTTGSKFELVVELANYVSCRHIIQTKSINNYAEICKDIYMVPLAPDNTITLSKVEFDHLSNSIKVENLFAIDEYVNILKQNPKIKLQVHVLQDSIYLKGRRHKKIYQKRAEELLRNFTIKGIQSERIILPEYKTYLAYRERNRKRF